MLAPRRAGQGHIGTSGSGTGRSGALHWLRSRTEVPVTVYALAQFTIDDPERYERYARRFAESLAGFDGHLLAADENPTRIEGTAEIDKVVLIAFPDRHEFERWATSSTYQEISRDRTAATTGTVLLITGADRRADPTPKAPPVAPAAE